MSNNPVNQDSKAMQEVQTNGEGNVVLSKNQYDELMEALKTAQANNEKLAERLNASPSVVVTETPQVCIMYMELCAPENRHVFGGYGTVSQLGDSFDVPYSKFFGGFLDNDIRNRLKYGGLVVKEGLSEKDYARLGIDYKKNAMLTPQVLDELPVMDSKKAVAIFKELPPFHQELVAKDMRRRFDSNDNRISIEHVKLFHSACKDKKLFKSILEAFNTKDLED